MHGPQAGLLRCLNPRSIAIIGGDIAEVVMRQCQLIAYTGEIWPVNPKRESLAGVPCYASIDDLPSAPDACYLAIPPAAVVETLAALAAMGAGGAVVYTAGFAEHSKAGELLQVALLEAAGDMAVIGPNCYGIINYLERVALWPDHQGAEPVSRGVAIIAQSGNIGVNLTMQQRGLPISYIMTVGNKAQLDFHDYIDVLIDDERVTAIGMHIEGLSNAAAFAQVAIRALTKKVPLVVLKTGESELGAELTMSHTRSLAGSNVLAAAFFQRLGIAMCRTVPEFLETLKFLNAGGACAGTRLISMSCSGGEAALMADLGERMHITFPNFNTASQAGLKQSLGERVHITNPLDYHTYVWGNEEVLTACFSAAAQTEADCLALVLDYPPSGRFDNAGWVMAERALLAARRTSKRRVAVVASLAENIPRDARDRLVAAGVPPMMGMAEFIHAFANAHCIGQKQLESDKVLPILKHKETATDGAFVDEWQSKRELEKAGVVCPRGRMVTLDNVHEKIEGLNFPIVAKTLDANLSHKSDVGGVRLNLRDVEGVISAIQAMSSLSHNFLIEEMITDCIAELIVGIRFDQQFGLALLVGAGGTGVELLNDTATLLLPARRDEIAAALSSLRIYPVLEGYRGGQQADIEAVVGVIENVAAYAVKNYDCLFELDINPLMAGSRGAIAADVLIRKRQTSNAMATSDRR